MNKDVYAGAKTLLKVEVTDNQEQVISARKLHEFLGIASRFSRWFEDQVGYGFTEGVDFTSVHSGTLVNNGAKREITDYLIKLDMAKELCMLSRSERGKQARQYFIQVEKEWNSPEKVMARALVIANTKINELTEKITLDAPKVNLANAITSSVNSILVRDLAKILSQNGYDTGEKRLYKTLREMGYLIKKKGMDYNRPTQFSMDRGLFEVRETTIENKDGSILTKFTTMVTGKGQEYFVNKFKEWVGIEDEDNQD